MLNKSHRVRESCQRVVNQAGHVKINEEAVRKFASDLEQRLSSGALSIKKYQEYSCHLSESQEVENLVNYCFVLDSLNFCFWPSTDGFEYDNLAQNVKNLSASKPECLQAQFLATVTREFVKEHIFGGSEFPLLDERARVLQEIGQVTTEYFGGRFINILSQAGGSVVKVLASDAINALVDRK